MRLSALHEMATCTGAIAFAPYSVLGTASYNDDKPDIHRPKRKKRKHTEDIGRWYLNNVKDEKDRMLHDAEG